MYVCCGRCIAVSLPPHQLVSACVAQVEQLELTVRLQPSGAELVVTVKPTQSPAALRDAVYDAARAGLHRTAVRTDIVAIRLGRNDLLGGACNWL